jgi:hypothetical protein
MIEAEAGAHEVEADVSEAEKLRPTKLRPKSRGP